jgi:terminase, large subunit
MNLFEAVNKSMKRILNSTRPLSLNQWAEKYGMLSAESSADIGKWKSIPYQRAMLDAISDETIEGVVIKKSARVGYTKIITHAIGYFIDHKPSPILIVQPTLEDAEGFSKEELAPYIRDVSVLNDKVSDAKAKDGTNTILHKLFPGGVLSVIGANSPRGFRRISRRVIILDEVSGYPKSAGPEGDPVQLAIRRSEFFWDRKIVAGSTPTLKDECKISEMFEETDQRRYYVPCPHCKHKQYLKFRNLKWKDDDPTQVWFECENKECPKRIIEYKHQRWMVENGEWRSTAESKKKKWVGFHIWAAYSYSPNSTWAHLVAEFLERKSKGRESLQTFVNTTLGEVFDDAWAVEHNIKDLQARAESYSLGHAPEGVIFCTAGVDVQDNRLAVQVNGWGHDDESWVINYMEIYGNPAEGKVWKALDDLLLAPIIHEKYEDMKVRAAAVDSGGHHTHEVYQYTRERRDRLYIAVKGSSQKNKPAIGKPSTVDINFKGKALKRGAQLYSLGVDTIKSTLFSRLKITDIGAKFVHFSFELVEDFYKGLQSEKKILKLKRGQRVVEWVKTYERNEPLDTWVYSFAAKEFFLTRYPKKLSVSLVEKELKLKNQTSQPIVKTNKPQKPRKAGGGFVNQW